MITEEYPVQRNVYAGYLFCVLPPLPSEKETRRSCVDLDGEVADCSARFEEVGPRDWYVNPDLIINQRSMPRPAAFAVTVKRLLPGYNLPQRIIDNSSPSFSENFTLVELKQEALTVDEYLDRFLYAWITPPSVRKPTGYNLEDFSSSSTLYDKLEFKR